MNISRRRFITGAGGLFLPIAAGLPLIARSELDRSLPSTDSYTATNQGGYKEITLFYSLEPSDGKPPNGSLSFKRGSGSDWDYWRIEYDSVSADGNTIRMSAASPGYPEHGSVPDNCREVQLTITEFSREGFGLFSSGTGKATLRLKDGTAYQLETDNGFPI